MSDVLFFHGLESGPQGKKARWLREHYNAHTPQMPSLEGLTRTLEEARKVLSETKPRVVVGSSFGGAVTVALENEGLIAGPVVLIAPAAGKLSVTNALPKGVRAVVFHSVGDPIVPYEDSVELVKASGSDVRLVSIEGDDHALNGLLEDGSLAKALEAFGVR